MSPLASTASPVGWMLATSAGYPSPRDAPTTESMIPAGSCARLTPGAERRTIAPTMQRSRFDRLTINSDRGMCRCALAIQRSQRPISAPASTPHANTDDVLNRARIPGSVRARHDCDAAGNQSLEQDARFAEILALEM